MIKKNKNDKNIIDYQTISTELNSMHSDFIKNLGPFSEKAIIDRVTIAQITNAKIFHICGLMKKLKIVDEIEKIYENTVCGTRISRYDSFFINILTDGDNIKVEFSDDYNILKYVSLRYDNVLSDDFDWLGFSKKLLYYVHQNLYERARAAETKMKILLWIISNK